MSAPNPSSAEASHSGDAGANASSAARAKEIFDAVVDADWADRAALLEQHCGGDAALKAEVQSLLDAHDQAGDFLAAPTVASAELPALAASPRLERIGPYRITRCLGEGGYGTVYLAAQEKPLRRVVAIKVIKAGMDTQQVIARFELERQTLAMMDHPHIARVYDAGSTEAGRPYFVMEYVDGQTVTQYCRSRDLGLEERLAIFDLVCAAVQHAHRKGVIHRDLKPSNVLVATVDGKPVPKVIDFGIAKALYSGGQMDRSLTEQALFIGTPQYMSPEQAQGPSADIDTRSDVYSLGVLLYELLTDSPPIEPSQIRQAMLTDVPRLLREIEPPPPSSRLRTRSAASRTTTADTGITRSADRIRGDLDWIVMKALEKDPDRRYPTAEALAADLTRYRRDEPVTAGPPSRAYRMRKFARRNRRWIVTGAAVVASLVIGLGAATIAMFHARTQRDIAVQSAHSEAEQRQIADRERQSAQSSAAAAKAEAAKVFAAQTFLYRMIAPSLYDDSSPIPPRVVIDYVEGKAGDGFLKDHPEVEGPLRLGLGRAYIALEVPAKAELQYGRAVEVLRPLEGPDSLNIASALHNLGTAILLQNDPTRAQPTLEQSLAMYRRVMHGDNIADAPAMAHVGLCRSRLGDPQGAEPILRDALEIFRKKYPPDHPQLVMCAGWLADVYEKLGDKEKADQARAAAKPRLIASPPKVISARDEAIKWVQAHMAFGPESDFPQVGREQLEKRTTKSQEFTILFGADLLASHRATRVSCVLGQLVSVEMSDEQAKAMGYAPKTFGVTTLLWPGRRMPAEVTLDEPQLDAGGEWDSLTPLTGRITIRPLKPLQPGEYALHLSYVVKNTTHIRLSKIDATAIRPDQPITFKFDPIKEEPATNPATRPAAPPAVRVVYIDLCRLVYNGKHPDLAVISDTRGLLLAAPKEPVKQVDLHFD